ncbi:hypothetical protein EV138_5220 [Kribbella voronezhensis]|uniref:RelA/SpoT family protein n=1 Tax=Kribbella voronezhensis TaxID=2512212 RepID=A0A4R7TH34_9ACTN|nr:hypothetical protein [Kribbella voronezhensis]TDU91611.1 hypothetical protein EV138_5220 [Kribbella voronezhensis]
MPPPELDDLPEPRDLHARLTTHRPLDWGDPLPTKTEIAVQFDESAAVRSLAMLRRAAEVERRVTADFTEVVPSGIEPHHLQHRMKSPQSLARKLSKFDNSGRVLSPEDLLRYTIVVPEPDDLVAAATDIVRDLQAKGWTMESAHHSYVDGSRYKGLHTFLRCEGELVELQIHSRESIEVKTRTTPLYEIERDPRQPRQARVAARAACISLSDGLRQPTGVAELTELGGVPVEIRKYGGGHVGPAARPAAGQPARQERTKPGATPTVNPRDGIER